MVRYYIGNDDETEDEEDATEEKPENKPPGFNDTKQQMKQEVTKTDLKEDTSNPWTEMAKSIQTEDLKSFQGIKRSLAKALLASGHSNGFDIAYQMIQCWSNADYNLPRLKIQVSKTKNENIFPPKIPIESASNKTENRKQKKRPYLSETLIEKLLKFKNNLTDDQIEFCVRKTIIYILIGTDGSVKGRSRFDEWKESYEPTKRTKKNQIKPNLPTSEIVFNYLPPGLRETEATNDPLTQKVNENLSSEESNCSKQLEKENANTHDNVTEGKFLKLCKLIRILKYS